MSAADLEVLADLRRARRKQRVAQIHWVDALYQVYITAILAIVAVVFLSGLTGDGNLDAAGIAKVVDHGPALIGVIASLALLIGLRSGCKGGPLALEKPDVRHVLLSPIDRGDALRSPTWRQIRFLSFAGAVAGAVAGQLAVRRLGGSWAAWIACCSATSVAIVWLSLGAALLASGYRLRSWIGTTVGLVLVAWSVADLTGRGPTAPLTFLGRLALWPLEFDALAVIPVVVAVVAVLLGARAVSGLSLEAAERRTALVGQMKFAVTLQDLRTVLVLRRQLAMELPRTKPWFGRPASAQRKRRARFPVWARGWRGVLRWPVARLLRLVGLAVIAGLSLRGAWDGTTPLVILGGLALWIAALDTIEPLAQETDHPGRLDAYPKDRGQVLLAHLPIALTATLLVTLLAAAVAVLVDPSTTAITVAAIALPAAAGAATAGAVISVLMGAPKPGNDALAMISPEVAGMRNLLRTIGPPLVAILGTAPVLAARAAVRKDLSYTNVEAAATIAVLTMVIIVAGWVRFRDDIRAGFQRMMEEAKANQELRSKPRPSTRVEAEDEDDEYQEDDDEYDEEDEYDEDFEDDEDVEYDEDVEDEVDQGDADLGEDEAEDGGEDTGGGEVDEARRRGPKGKGRRR